MNSLIQSNKNRLEALYKRASAIPDPADQIDWSKYLCVLTAGHIEESLRVLLLDFSKRNSSPRIQKYLEREIRYITNCNSNRIVEILGKFDSTWVIKFETEIKARSPIDKEVKDSLDSVISNRHLIAHGKSVGITYSKLKGYYGYCAHAIDILDKTII